ncbi:MAG: RsmB/NOP family class I SAM-dependent RNA methyltransferase [Clostridia bacterium]|jgi:NOL1/NOP2/sun family putative RNA methylase|nr:RsmB/NOP family class I SAM-dependent RNA methyltransferase [Clostridia bacterium]
MNVVESMLPQFLNEMLKNQYGEDNYSKIVHGYNSRRYTTLRVNTIKTDINTIKNILKEKQIEFEEVEWFNEALIIKNVTEKEIEKLDIYENGEIYLQSLSSMLPPIILEPKEKENILDMTAAPGGKTTQMAAITNNNAMITACEMNNIRFERLKYNLEKQGATSVYAMMTDARKMDDFFSFDKILLDAPCSGSGTINIKDINLKKNFTEKLVNKSAVIQIALLKKAIKMLKKGNIMVYSTCSILSKENEEVIEKILKEENAEILPIEFKGIEKIPKLKTSITGTLCVCPNELYEGFFVVKLRKK